MKQPIYNVLQPLRFYSLLHLHRRQSGPNVQSSESFAFPTQNEVHFEILLQFGKHFRVHPVNTEVIRQQNLPVPLFPYADTPLLTAGQVADLPVKYNSQFAR